MRQKLAIWVEQPRFFFSFEFGEITITFDFVSLQTFISNGNMRETENKYGRKRQKKTRIIKEIKMKRKRKKIEKEKRKTRQQKEKRKEKQDNKKRKEKNKTTKTTRQQRFNERGIRRPSLGHKFPTIFFRRKKKKKKKKTQKEIKRKIKKTLEFQIINELELD